MASTASTVLRQELMAQGENDSTWGTKTNTNLGMLESAITGTTAISTTGGTTTLSNVDYTNDQAKKHVLDISGTLVSNAIIVIPNASKTYKIFNRTTGSFTVTVKTSGGSAITITQSTVCEVYCNASDVVRFATPLTDYTLGAPATASGAAASAVSVTPTGNLASTDAQAALAELQGDIDTLNTAILTYQPLDSDLTTIAGLAKTDSNIIVGNGSAWVVESGATARASLGLTIGTNVQAYDVELAALAGLTSAADRLPYFTGSGTAALATFTTFARSILDDADEATFKATVNLEIGTDVQAYDADLTTLGGLSKTKGNLIVASGAAWAAEAVGTNGYFLVAKSGATNGVTWASVIPATTVALFYQAAAPTGWTVSDADSNKAIRIVSGASGLGGAAGGTTAFTSVFTSRIISGSELPAHTHAVGTLVVSEDSHTHFVANTDSIASGGAANLGASNYLVRDTSGGSAITYELKGTATTANIGLTSSDTHDHSLSGATAAAGSSSAMDFAVQYISVIKAAKDAY